MVAAPPLTAGVGLPSYQAASPAGGVPAIRAVVSVASLPATPPPSSAVPAIAATARVKVPGTWEGTFQLTSPADESTVATAEPTFVVGVVADGDPATTYTLQIQYAADAAFTTPTSILADFELAAGGAVVTPDDPITVSPVYWRARLLLAGEPIGGWSGTSKFYLDLDAGHTDLPVTWTVSVSASRPIHLWHYDPPGPLVGDLVTVYGQGFPTSGHLKFGGVSLTVESWQRIPEDLGNTVNGNPVIDGTVITCEHYEVVFAAPFADGDGALLTVEA